MFKSVLVANRGAVAARVIRTLKRMGIRSVAVYSEADSSLPYIQEADAAYSIGAAAPLESYLNQMKLLAILKESGCDAVHPGYGFLSENFEFAQKVNDSGACFIGPSPKWIEAMGHKVKARELMAAYGMPMAPASDPIDSDWDEISPECLVTINKIGFPVLVKPANGGGGIGMLPANNPDELKRAFAQARSLSSRSFGSSEVYVERLIEKPRHIEFQVLADRDGNVRVIFERDCSVQRRNQKVIEEAPAPLISREALMLISNRIAELLTELKYDVIGTVEMLYDGNTGDFHFLEMNTRLQVEHAVTEEITGIDIVEAQLRLSAGERIDDVLPASIICHGHAVEVRIYAEDPVRFFPSPGSLDLFTMPKGNGIRVETGYSKGSRITSFYDPMIAKIIAHAPTRSQAIDSLVLALHSTEIMGVKTNIPFVLDVLNSESFRAGDVHTGIASKIKRTH